MSIRHRLPIVLLCLCGFAQLPASAHDHTRKAFQRQRALVAAQARQHAEPAPQTKNGQKACQLAVELTLANQGKPVAGLVRITNQATGKTLDFAAEIKRDAGWYALAPGTTLEVPPAKITVEAVVGLHTERIAREIDLTGKANYSLKLPLKTFYDPAAKRLVAGNTHLHLMRLTHDEAFRYLRVVPHADALDLVFISHLKRTPEDSEYTTNSFTDGDLGRLSREGVLFGNGQEHRHNFGPGDEGFGHVMLLNILRLIEPVSIGPGIMKAGTDGIPLQRGIKTARRDNATVIWCHNTFGHEDIPNWVAGLVHAQNIHDGGSHGSYEDTFYRYLNVGMQVPFSTGTDWFIYDFNRVYIPLEGELTSRKWLASLAAGKSYITNGPFLELACDGKPIGETVATAAGKELHITGGGIGRADFQRLELIHNGEVIQTVESTAVAGHHEAALDYRLKITEPGWIALRVPTGGGKNEFDKPIFGHTSPIYIETAGKRIFRSEVARGLIVEMEQSREFIAAKGLFASDEEKEAVLGVYRKSIDQLRQQIEP